MSLDWFVSLAGLLVGFTVGFTGMGGGALMTPILVLLFKVQPLAAVSSDLVAAMVMKPVGGAVHFRRGTVHTSLVRWLMVGSIPSAFAGVLVLKSLGHGPVVERRIEFVLGAALLVAASSIVAKGLVQAGRLRRRRELVITGTPLRVEPFSVRKTATVLVGVIGGLVVGMTSVGSGSLIIVMLLFLYPMLSARELVGTDLVQAIPLVMAAAVGHLLFGDFRLSLTASMLVGSIPGVYAGARMSSRAPDGIVRPALVIVLMATGLKLLGLGTAEVGLAVLAVALLAPPAWGIVDAISHPGWHWDMVGKSRQRWVAVQAAGAPFGVGLAVAIAYFLGVRPELRAAAIQSFVAVSGNELTP